MPPQTRRLRWRRLSPRARGLLAAVGTTLLTSQLTGPIAAEALAPPWELSRLWPALAACGAALILAALVGRTVTRQVAGEQAL